MVNETRPSVVHDPASLCANMSETLSVPFNDQEDGKEETP
jgi:hypothetical protein